MEHNVSFPLPLKPYHVEHLPLVNILLGLILYFIFANNLFMFLFSFSLLLLILIYITYYIIYIYIYTCQVFFILNILLLYISNILIHYPYYKSPSTVA